MLGDTGVALECERWCWQQGARDQEPQRLGRVPAQW